MNLTKKQELFCQEAVRQNYLSDAYKIAYSTSKMKETTINERASRLAKEYKISTRISELKRSLADKEMYTLEQSVKRDLKLIERYEGALDVLESSRSKVKDIEAAERTIKFIGSHGYNSAQERLSKQHGFFEMDNSQKTSFESFISLTSEDRVARINELRNQLKKKK